MKNLLKLMAITFATVCVVGLSSCSKDDDDDKQTDKIVGTWEQTWEEGWYIEDGKKTTVSGKPETAIWYVFKDNGTGYEYEAGYEDYPWNFIWNITNGTLNLRSAQGDDTESYKIDKLNSSTLILEASGKDEDGYEYYGKLTYTKK